MLGILVFVIILFVVRGPRRPMPPPGIMPPAVSVGSGSLIDETGADVTRRETTFTKTFPLASTARFSLENLRGAITVEAWDQPHVEVRVVKRGGSMSDRASIRVDAPAEGPDLTLRTVPTRGGTNVQVDYFVRLPRKLRLVEIKGVSSDVKLSDVNAAVSVKSGSGSIELSDITGDIQVENTSGAVSLANVVGQIVISTLSGDISVLDATGSAKAQSVSGNLKIAFKEVKPGPLEFTSKSGDIEIAFHSPFDADLEAATVSGDIELPADFAIDVRRQIVGEHARGRIGAGGRPLRITAVSGDIKVTK
jgi:DUF4097 and DUF4098 domain-containing protein YvlB